MDKIKGAKLEKINKLTTRCFEKCEFVDLCSKRKKTIGHLEKISEKTCRTISRNFWVYTPTKILKEKEKSILKQQVLFSFLFINCL